MLNLLSFSEVMIFAVVSKMEPDSFKRTFRSNKAMNRFITQTKRRFNIWKTGQIRMVQRVGDQMFLEFKEKHYFEAGYEETYSLAEMRKRFRNSLGYFRYETIILDLIDNQFFEEEFTISSVTLEIECDEALSAAADAIRPQLLELSPPTIGIMHGISPGVLKRLDLVSVFFNESGSDFRHHEGIIDLFTSLLPHAVVSDDSHLQDIHIIKELETFYRLGDGVPNTQYHREYNQFQIGASNIEAWSIRLEKRIVLITEHVSRDKKHHIHIATLVDFKEFREFHQEHLKAAVKIGARGARRALSMQQMWDRVTGNGLRRSSTPVS